MAFSADLDDAVSRVRFVVGDTGEPPLMRGGEAVYEALLAANGDDEAVTARAAAAALAAYYATQPSSLSGGGESVTWAERIAQWNRIAVGATPGSAATAASGAQGGPSTVEARW